MIAPVLAWREPVVKAVATLGFALVILGMVSFLRIDDLRSFSLPTDKIGVKLLGLRVSVTRLIVFLTLIGLVVEIYIFLGRTKIGLNMQALPNNRDLSALVGIPILKVKTIAWGLSGVIAGTTSLAMMVQGWVLALAVLRVLGLYLALITLMAAGGLEINLATFQFPNGGTFKASESILLFALAVVGGARYWFGAVIAAAPDGVDANFSKPVSGIIGPNGAGKTALMNAVSGFVATRGGQIIRDGENLRGLAPDKRAHWGLRRSFQKEEIADDLTIEENVLVQTDHSPQGAARKRQEEMRVLEIVGMADRVEKSGTLRNSFERRLTDVAKCLVGQPKVIMFDEPAGGLSFEETARLGDLFLGIHDRTGHRHW